MPRWLAPLLMLLPWPAMAAPLPTVGVVGLHQERLTPDEQARAGEALVRAVEGGGFYDARVLTELAPYLVGREELVLQDAFLDPGRRLLEDGRLLYNQAEFDQAIRVLREATETLRLGVAAARSTRELWDAWVHLGAAYQSAGQGRDARDAFEHAISLSRYRSLDPAVFPPHLVERFEAIRKERAALGSTLLIDADERDTVIWLNGEEQGTTPLVLEDVLPGENFVHARSPAGFFAYQPVVVPEAGTKDLDLRLGEPTLGYPSESPSQRSRQVSSLYRTLGEHLPADLILIAGTSGSTLYLQLYSPRSDSFSIAQELSFSGSAADETVLGIDALLRGVSREGILLPDNRATQAAPIDVGANQWLARTLVVPRDVDDESEAKKKGWAKWVVIGLVGAGAAVGAGYGVKYLTTDPHQGTVIVVP